MEVKKKVSICNKLDTWFNVYLLYFLIQCVYQEINSNTKMIYEIYNGMNSVLKDNLQT